MVNVDKAAELAARTANEERRPATNVAPHNLRDHLDTRPLTRATDGQVPVYDEATGTWRPGTAGAGLSTVAHFVADPVTVPTATTTWVSGLSSGFGGFLSGSDVEIIATTDGVRFLTAATYSIQMHVDWPLSATGVRQISVTHTALTVPGRVSDTTAGVGSGALAEQGQTTPAALFQPAANSIAAFSLWQDSGGDLDAEVHIYVARLI